MDLEHIKDIVGWCEDNFFSLGKNHRLQHIDGLSDVRHPNTVAVIVEDIQIARRGHRIAHGVLLIQERRIGSRFNSVPCSPFIHNQRNFFVWVSFIHDGAMPGKIFIHLQSILENIEPFALIEVGCSFPVAEGIVVQRESV